MCDMQGVTSLLANYDDISQYLSICHFLVYAVQEEVQFKTSFLLKERNVSSSSLQYICFI